MALPTTPPGVAFTGPPYDVGPFISSGGNVYVVMESSGTAGDIVALKATDPTDDATWAEQDAANRPSSGFTAESLWVTQDGDTLHVATQQNTDPGGMNPDGLVVYSAFDMSTDTWTMTDVTVTQPADPQVFGAVITVRSDGDIVIAFQDVPSKEMGTDYTRVSYTVSTDGGTNWSTPVAVDTGGTETDWFISSAILGASDRTHFHLHRYAGGADGGRNHRSLSSTDSLDTIDEYDTTSSRAIGRGVAYDDGGTVRVRVTEADVSAETLTEYDSGANPTITRAGLADGNFTFLTHTNSSSGRSSDWPLATVDVDGTDEHALFVELTTDDLFRDENTGSGWGTDVEVEDAITANHLSAHIYDRGGSTVFAYLIDKSGTVEYNEVTLAAAGPQELSQTLNATAVGSVSIDRLLELKRTLAPSAVGSASITRQSILKRSLSATATGSPTVDRLLELKRALSTSATGSAQLNFIVAYAKTLAASATGVASLERLLELKRTLSASAVGSANIERLLELHRTLAPTASGNATLNRLLELKRLLDPTATGVAGLSTNVPGGVQEFAQTLTATATGVVSIDRALELKRALDAVAVVDAQIARLLELGRSLQANATGTADLDRTLELARLLGPTATGVASLSTSIGPRELTQTLSATAVAVADIERLLELQRVLAPAATGSADLARLLELSRTLAGTSTASAVVNRTLEAKDSLSATASGSATLSTNVLPAGDASVFKKTLAATAQGAASMDRDVRPLLGVNAPHWQKVHGIHPGGSHINRVWDAPYKRKKPDMSES